MDSITDYGTLLLIRMALAFIIVLGIPLLAGYLFDRPAKRVTRKRKPVKKVRRVRHSFGGYGDESMAEVRRMARI